MPPKIYFISVHRSLPKTRKPRPWPRQRQKRRKSLLISLPLLFIALLWFLSGPLQGYLPSFFTLVSRITDGYQLVLGQGLPAFAAGTPTATWPREGFLVETMYALTGIKAGDPKTYLDSQLTMLASRPAAVEVTAAVENLPLDLERDYSVANPAPAPDEISRSQGPEEAAGSGQVAAQPVVVLYSTHNGETYLPNDGVERVEGKNAGVVEVATALARTLEREYDIKVVQSTKIHDYPSYERAYNLSAITAQAMIKQNPSAQMVFDVHRDAGFEKAEVVKINGTDAARMLIVVGSLVQRDGKTGGNTQFAQRVREKVDTLYPGLLKGVRVKEGRYNQHLHPNALLIEFGNSHNTLAQAKYSAELFARVVAELAAEMRKESTL